MPQLFHTPQNGNFKAIHQTGPDAFLHYAFDEEVPSTGAFWEKPASVVLTPRQFLQALTKAGLRAAVEAAVAAGSQDLKDWYNRATEFESTHPVLLVMAQTLGKTKADVDALFQMGATL